MVRAAADPGAAERHALRRSGSGMAAASTDYPEQEEIDHEE